MEKIVLWEYERSGWFMEHIFNIRNKQIEHIVDDNNHMSFKLHIFHSFIFRKFGQKRSGCFIGICR